jgi:hypothetical protein
LSDGLVTDDALALKIGTTNFDLGSVLVRVLYRNDSTLIDRGP